MLLKYCYVLYYYCDCVLNVTMLPRDNDANIKPYGTGVVPNEPRAEPGEVPN